MQRCLPPTPNRNSPYGVYNYDRWNNGSPVVYQRISELSINEQSENDQSKWSVPHGRERVLPNEHIGQSPYQQRRYNQDGDYSRMGPRPPVSGSEVCNYSDNSPRTKIQNSAANVLNSSVHDSSRSSGSSFDNGRVYNSRDQMRTPTNQMNQSHGKRDSPRESGYSSREHSIHRNSPCDTTQPNSVYSSQYRNSPSELGRHHNSTQPHSGYGSHDHSIRSSPCNTSHSYSYPHDPGNSSVRIYEDISSFETHSDPLSQVSSSTDSGYGPHLDKVQESPIQYAGEYEDSCYFYPIFRCSQM